MAKVKKLLSMPIYRKRLSLVFCTELAVLRTIIAQGGFSIGLYSDDRYNYREYDELR